MAPVTTLDEIMSALNEHRAALDRLQTMLEGLSQAAQAAQGRGALVSGVVDPAHAGYSLSQRELAMRVGLPPSTVSALVRAFRLDEDAACAMVVRPGERRLVNFHERAVARFLELLTSPPDGLDARAQRLVEQARQRRGGVARAA